jgi:RHS repeat-associated protein
MYVEISKPGYAYFGARYYDSELSVWLSVDPLSDKYPSMSPFMYTADNPIMLVDPDGMSSAKPDHYSVSKEGDVKLEKETDDKYDMLYTKGDYDTGKKDNGVKVKDKTILPQLAKLDGNGNRVAVGNKKTQNEMTKVFKFLADNSDVEWRMDRYNENGKQKYSLGSDLSLDTGTGQKSISSEEMGHSSESVISFVHSHPNTSLEVEKSSMGWWTDANGNNTIYGGSDIDLKMSSALKNSIYYTYFPKSGNLFVVRKYGEPAYIRKIGNNYKRFFFGTLNTK